jgi:hypothetical protein
VVFENGIPNLYDGGFESGEDILEWIVSESSGDHTIGKPLVLLQKTLPVSYIICHITPLSLFPADFAETVRESL